MCVSARVVDGIEDDGHTFQFNVEQSETKSNVTGKDSRAAQCMKHDICGIGAAQILSRSCAAKKAGLNVNNKRRSLMRQTIKIKINNPKRGRQAGSNQAKSGVYTKDRTTEKRQQSSNKQGKEWHNI